MPRRKLTTLLNQSCTTPNNTEIYRKVKMYGDQYFKKYTRAEVRKLGEMMLEFYLNNEEAMYFTAFLKYSGLSRYRIDSLRKKDRFFNECYESARDIIVDRWIKVGHNSGKPVFAIFALKNIASDQFKDTHKVEHNVDGGIMIEIKDATKELDAVSKFIAGRKTDKRLRENRVTKQITEHQGDKIITKTATLSVTETNAD